MKYLFLIIIAFSFVSCETTEDVNNSMPPDEPTETIKGTLEEQMIRHIKDELGITAIEKYEYEVFKEELNGDDSTDWIISVNLLDRAINKAIQTKTTAKMAELGYMGNYNYIIFMDGSTKKFSPAVAIQASAYGKLIVEFEYLTSKSVKGFTVDLKIRNSRRRRFYTISNNTPLQICESVIYYNLGLEGKETESYVIEYKESANGPFNDIIVYEGELEQKIFEDKLDVYDFEPTITSTGKIAHVWHYNPIQKMYYIDKTEI